jgi:hypothetical protein
MNANDQISTDVDKTLSAFFKAEMPDPFPDLKLPAATKRADMPMPVSGTRERQPIYKSRVALAASVALLLGGCWYLSGQIGKAPDRPTVDNKVGGDNAKLPKAIQNATKDLKKATMP